ncbi:glutaminase A [Arthrobacter antioxidans]|uniref:glutaminase A n=1 Tax=Arthrobacter antioxidans TaxID=2895818 RepID=UPI00200019C3|nr:glutaminase A [Arthrobacter antioxidans]
MESPIESYLKTIHREISELRDGKPYSSIPAMANVDPDNFGICLTTVDGYMYEVGDTREEFTIQSISKPFTYGLALADLGMEAVDAKVDVEPSGDTFNEISLAPGSGRPSNAMINAGALTATSLVRSRGGNTRFKRILSTYSQFAGRQLGVDEEIFRSELDHGHRNRALAYLLRSFDIIESDPTPVIEDYFRQCSVMVNCMDLSVMAATLANSGRNPITGVEALDLLSVERVLSVMTTCGMYDDAGSWISTVGMPAKSGVAGGTIAVLPGQVGLAIYSPPLDEHGSSVRGMATSQRLSRDMELHFVRAARAGKSAIRATYDILAAPSGIRRTEEAMDVLRDHAHQARVIELNGDLLFAGTESMVRELSGLDDDVDFVILDLRRVDEVADVSLRLLGEVRENLTKVGCDLVLIDGEGTLAETFKDVDRPVPTFDTRTAAVEWCENELITRYGGDLLLPSKVEVSQCPALSPLTRGEVEALTLRMEDRTYEKGHVVRRVGQSFGGVYFILSGKIVTSVPGPSGERLKLTTLSAGMTFGELALGSDDRQETTVKALEDVHVKVLTAQAIRAIEKEDPNLAVELWKALTRDAYTRVDLYLRETAVRIRD